MELKKYQHAAQRTNPDLGTRDLNNYHMLFGMSTEVGELEDVFKKNLAYGKPIDWVNVEEEVGDLLWYIVNFCTINEIDIERAMGKNISKLFIRYPDKFSGDNALVRDLEAERKVLESKGSNFS